MTQKNAPHCPPKGKYEEVLEDCQRSERWLRYGDRYAFVPFRVFFSVMVIRTLCPYFFMHEQRSDRNEISVLQSRYEGEEDELKMRYIDCFMLLNPWAMCYSYDFTLIIYTKFQLMKLGQAILGKTLFAALMKRSFYGQFVAGEDQVRVTSCIEVWMC